MCFTIMLSSCQKEGCTNKDAINYDASAKKDDGSCIFPTPDPIPSQSHLNPNLTYGSVTDIEGNTYATIIIGTQEWMAENLRTSKYCNGDSILNVTSASQWGILTNGAWAHFENDSQYELPYGKLYNWFAVADSRNVCPCGWHVPSHAEWTILTDYLGGFNVAGGKMKSISMEYWQDPNSSATNESGFSGLPGGGRFQGNGAFGGLGEYGYWWSTTEQFPDAADVWARGLNFDFSYVNQVPIGKNNGFSIRCVRD